MAQIAFGVKSKLDLAEHASITVLGSRASQEAVDPEVAIRAALADPLGFPPLRDAVVPGDRVAIALGEGLVQPARLVAGVVGELMDAGIEPDMITVVRSAADARLSRQSPTNRLPEEIQARIRVEIHDATDRNALMMLSVSASDEPIYLNRTLVDADVVVPIGVARHPESLGYLGAGDSIFPVFADEQTQKRFRSPRSALDKTQHDRRSAESDEASWMLGTPLIVRIVPGQGERVLKILAGDVAQVEPASRLACQEIWGVEVLERASIVVATIPGARVQQSWAHVARALDAAQRVVQDDGMIVVCCDLKSRPGPSLRRLGRAKSLEAASQLVKKDKTSDALAALELIRALRRTRVFLLSRLDEERVHDLGVGYVETPEEVARLVSRQDTCIVLENAQQVFPYITEEVFS